MAHNDNESHSEINTSEGIEIDSANEVNATMNQEPENSFSCNEGNESNGCLLKWTFLIISGVILLGLLVWGKLSFLSLAEAMHNDDDFRLQSRCRLFVMLQIILCLPQVLNFIRGVWNGCIKTHNAISWYTYGGVIIVSLMEAAGSCLYAFRIPGLSKTHHITLLMCCIFFFPTLSNIFIFTKKSVKSWRSIIREKKPRKCIIHAFIVVLAEAGAVGFTLSWSKDDRPITLLAICILSISWMPCVRRWLCDLFKKGVPEKLTNATVWKLSAIMSLCNLVFTIIGSFSMFFIWDLGPYISSSNLTTTVDWQDYVSGWHWDEWKQATRHEIILFITHIVSGILGYMVAYVTCKARLHNVSFLLPLISTAPITFIILVKSKSCEWVLTRKGMATHLEDCTIGEGNHAWDITRDITAIVLFILAHLVSSGYKFWTTNYLQHLSEEQIFRLPAYNSIFLDHWLLLNGQNKEDDSKVHIDPKEVSMRTKIYICTTMYRESDFEMEQFITSVKNIKKAQSLSGRNIEIHIFFDDAVRDKSFNEFVVQLVTKVEKILNCKEKNPFKKLKTPFGICLSWDFNVSLPFKIHLKDAFKVKKKKRWSQVMYMSYVLEYLLKKDSGDQEQPSTSLGSIQTSNFSGHSRTYQPVNYGAIERQSAVVVDPQMESYLLVTDADVTFTSDSVEYLLDLVMRDANLGAVCARTHPKGSGPLYWYQVFEYAAGHWLQKAAEQVLGTVLCAPGCFSIYRCKAVGEVLSEYASEVEHAFDFLIKDMGEDRWFCTLMVQKGWFIEYCAASKVETNCPHNFAEFFKQRRRWLASTVANLWLLIKDWGKVRKENHRVSWMFRIYQALLLFASLICPSSTILVVAGGLKYGWDLSTLPTIILQLIVSFGFGIVCLKASQETQIKMAKILTVLYAVAMAPVTVGMVVQITMEFINKLEAEPNLISHDIRVSTLTVFLSFVLGLLLLTGIMHIKEFVYLFHGLWYLLCLPAGYLILPIYSICNITDKSWGTRESQTHAETTADVSWLKAVKNVFRCCNCCPSKIEQIGTVEENDVGSASSGQLNQDESTFRKESCCPNKIEQTGPDEENDVGSVSSGGQINQDENTFRKEIQNSQNMQRQSSDDLREQIDSDAEDEDEQEIKNWLQRDMQTNMSDVYETFVKNGYDQKKFISGMTKRDIKDIGITSTVMLGILEKKIKELPDASSEISPEVPDDINSWLQKIGLMRYKDNFESIGNNVEVLTYLRSKEDIKQELNITKKGHVKWLVAAIGKLRHPNNHEKAQLETKKMLKEQPFEQQEVAENEFWTTRLESMSLKPNTFDHSLKQRLSDNLVELRNNWLMVFTVSNVLWLILIATLAYKGEVLNVFGTNAIGLVVLIILVFLLLVQFIAMMIHRISTLIHHVGRASYKWKGKKHVTFAFNERDMYATHQNDVRNETEFQGHDNNDRSQLI